MEQRQETKSLPRNRKCGNCRYFEPAPLWRKGWCRNPRLYDRRANHLVDASSIDCEQVFRARIYWEPIPTPDESDRLISPFNVNTYDNNDYGSADGGRNTRPAVDGVLRPTQGKPLINRSEKAQTLTAEPIMTDRERAEAAPNIVKKESQIRKWLLENIPYYNKVDGFVGRVNWLAIAPWLVIGLLAIIILINIGGGSSSPNTNSTPSPNGTASAGNLFAPSLGNIPTQSAGTPQPATNTNNGSKLASPTPTLSNAIPTQPPQATPTKAAPTSIQAKVVNTGTAKELNMRSSPSKVDTKNIVSKIPEGTMVEVVGGPTTAEGMEWWQVKYKDKTGWASKEFLEQVKP